MMHIRSTVSPLFPAIRMALYRCTVERRLLQLSCAAATFLLTSLSVSLLQAASIRDYEVYPEGDLYDAAFTPDGDHMVTASSGGWCTLWDNETNRRIRRYDGHDGPVASVTISSDGGLLASAGLDGFIKIWNLASGEELMCLSCGGEEPFEIAFSPNSHVLLAGFRSGFVDVYDLDSSEAPNYAIPFLYHRDNVNCIAFSEDGRRILTAGGGRVTVWEVAHNNTDATQPFDSVEEVRSFTIDEVIPEFPYWYITDASMTRDGRRVLIENMLFDVNTGDLLHTFGTENDKSIVSPAGGVVLTVNVEGVCLFDINSGEPIEAFTPVVPPFYLLPVLSADGNTLSIIGSDGVLYFYNIAAERLDRFIDDHYSSIAAVAFSKDGTRLLAGSAGSMLRYWDADTKDDITSSLEIPGFLFVDQFSEWEGPTETEYNIDHLFNIASISFSNDGHYILTGGTSAILWDAETGRFIHEIPYLSVTAVDFCPDNERFLLVDGSEVDIYSTQSEEPILTLDGFLVESAVFSPDGREILTGNRVGTAILWDLATGEEIQRFERPDQRFLINSVMFSPDGEKILISDLVSATIWDKRGEIIRTFSFNDLINLTASFSPDGKHVVTGYQEDSSSSNVRPVNHYGLAILWDVDSGEIVRKFEGPFTGISEVAFSPDGQRLVTADLYDATIREWGIDETTKVWNWRMH